MPQNVSKLIPIPSKLHTPSILSHRGDKTASLQQLMKLVGKNEEFFQFCTAMKPLADKYLNYNRKYRDQDDTRVRAFLDEASTLRLMKMYDGEWPVMSYMQVILDHPESRGSLREPSSEPEIPRVPPPRVNRAYVLISPRRVPRVASPLSEETLEVLEFLQRLNPPQQDLLDMFLEDWLEQVLNRLNSKGELDPEQYNAVKRGFEGLTKNM